MAARVVGIWQEGVNPCRMVPSKREEVHVQLHDVMGGVQGVRLSIAALVRELRVAAQVLRIFFFFLKENKSKPRFRVNRIPRSGVKDPLVRAQETTS